MSANGQPKCGKWMPRARAYCARRPGHRGECRTPAALAERRERLTERRRGQTLVTPEARARWYQTYKLKRMGLTPERFAQLLEDQGNACAMCLTPFEEDQRICIDHDHACCPQIKRSCGKCVRGLLCLTCNIALGYIEAYSGPAAAYLRQSSPQIPSMMRGGHLAAAASTASNYAAQLDRSIPEHTPESLSVYGSLLLRGAIAAAEKDDRATADELLAEADNAGQRLGADGNLRGTGFGPTNAKQHRVNIAVALGDAGTAVHIARGIDLDAIELTERKASLLIDTARAFLQWGKHEQAYIALRAAEDTAHEEVAGRPASRRLVRELVTTSPPTVRREAEQFAIQVGVTR